MEIIHSTYFEGRGVRSLVETIVNHEVPPHELVATSFCLAFDDRGRLLMVRLADRDWHPTGGHREAGETPEQAAIRETQEEGGCVVDDLVVVAVQRVTVKSATPPDWPYPVPISYQVFFAGLLDRPEPCAGTEAVEARLFGEEAVRASVWATVWAGMGIYDAALAVWNQRWAGVDR